MERRRETETKTRRKRDRKTGRERESKTESYRQTDTDRKTETETERDRERQRETERESGDRWWGRKVASEVESETEVETTEWVLSPDDTRHSGYLQSRSPSRQRHCSVITTITNTTTSKAL